MGQEIRESYQDDLEAAGWGSAEAADAALVHSRQAMETFRQSTEPMCTRKHAGPHDLVLVQDLFLCESLQRNKALLADAFMALEENTAVRTSAVANTRYDQADPHAQFHDLPPAMLKHLRVDTAALNAGRGRVLDGAVATTTCVLEVQTCKRSRGEDYSFHCAMTPNHSNLLRTSWVRFARFLLVRGAFAGSYTRRRAFVVKLVTSENFCGLTAQDAGFETEEEHAEACAQLHWRLAVGTGDWALLPHVENDGSISQTKSATTLLLGSLISAAGLDLGFEPRKFGVWSIRKKVCDDLVRSGRPEDASRTLQHRKEQFTIFLDDMTMSSCFLPALPSSEKPLGILWNDQSM